MPVKDTSHRARCPLPCGLTESKNSRNLTNLQKQNKPLATSRQQHQRRRGPLGRRERGGLPLLGDQRGIHVRAEHGRRALCLHRRERTDTLPDDMSSRFYPLYRKGNPQLRVYLPNLWMKLVNPEHAARPPNKLTFHVSSEMSASDVKNYLEKIYKVPVMNVRTINLTGPMHMHKQLGFIYKERDVKVAHVTLAKDFKFEFPDVVNKAKTEKEEKKAMGDLEEAKKVFAKQTKSTNKPGRKGLPSFFGL